MLVVVVVIILQIRSLNKPVETSGRVTDGTAWGPASAPVKIVEYADFGCSYCNQFSRNQGKQLRAEYEATGKVRFEYRSLIIESGGSTRDAANAAYCAADQGRFWDYADILHSKSGTSPLQVVFAKSALKGYGAQLGLDTAAFDRCVDGGARLGDVQAQHQEGTGRGINSTPTFFVNNKKIQGAVPYGEFKAAIDAALAGG